MQYRVIRLNDMRVLAEFDDLYYAMSFARAISWEAVTRVLRIADHDAMADWQYGMSNTAWDADEKVENWR